MRKIMYSDSCELTRLVLERKKTQTRRRERMRTFPAYREGAGISQGVQQKVQGE